ncbi:Thiosulfate sulfurtransferase rhodanese [Bacillus paralicheniformis]|nr:Thiosulfate sulfurtransferase rhodanese [Bacillus paralicheniformis]
MKESYSSIIRTREKTKGSGGIGLSVLKSPEWVYKRLRENPDQTVIVDVRFHLTKPDEGRKTYTKSHVPRAVYIDLKEDLSRNAEVHGGRHPLQDPDRLAAKLGKIGIDRETDVIVYDDSGGMFAARFWWQLHYLGHDSVYIMDGGLSNWIKSGYAMTAEVPRPIQREFKPALRENELLDAGDVLKRIGRKGSILIDARDPSRYTGENEPLDHRAGHIPGAKNFFWKSNLTESGLWKSKEQLRQHYAVLDPDSEIVVYCGSGVSACPNVLGLKEAGFENVKLYAGSWSDWISYPDHPISTGTEDDT